MTRLQALKDEHNVVNQALDTVELGTDEHLDLMDRKHCLEMAIEIESAQVVRDAIALVTQDNVVDFAAYRARRNAS